MIRQSKITDLTAIMPLFYEAIENFKKKNIDQWQNGSPNENLIKNDIMSNCSYVYEDKGQILAYFCLKFEDDITYKVINDGNWKTSKSYGVLHRVVVSKLAQGRGIAKQLFNFAHQKARENNKNMRIDTHKDNLIMQGLIKSFGYEYCGIIHVSDGSERLAYELQIENGSTKKVKDFFDNLANNWDSYSKNNDFVLEKLINLLHIDENSRIIDLACGTGVMTKKIVQRKILSITAIDISENMINIALEKIKDDRVTFVAKDFLDLDIAPHNKLIMYNALPHFLDRKRLADKISSVMEKDGLVLVCHSAKREAINECHKKVSQISTQLNCVEEEFQPYKTNFQLVDFLDDENGYFFLMQKK